LPTSEGFGNGRGNYEGKVQDAMALLNHAVATEIVCVLRYKFHAVCAAGLASEAVKEE
jgi:bacterioferritin